MYGIYAAVLNYFPLETVPLDGPAEMYMDPSEVEAELSRVYRFLLSSSRRVRKFSEQIEPKSAKVKNSESEAIGCSFPDFQVS